MTNGWEIKRLGDACDLQNGFAFKSELFKPKGIPVLRISSIQDEQVCDNRPVFANPSDYAENLQKYFVNEGDLLIAMSGATTGKVGFNRTGRQFLLNQRVGKFQPPPQLDINYLFYFLSTKVEENLKISAGSAQPNLSTKQINDFLIPLPPLPEQKRIVAILDGAFAGIAAATANAEKNLANARELFDLSLEAIFTKEGNGWVQRPFSDICEITSKLVDPREPRFIDLPHLGAGNMVSKTGELIEIKTAREEELKSGKFLFDESMVLYSKIRPYLMKACRPDFSGLCSADVYPLFPKPALLNRNFLFYLLLSRKFTEFAIGGSDRAGMPKVNRDHLFSYKAWLPDVKEQRLLASKLDEISSETNRIELIYQRKISALAELKQAILQKAFSGELTGIKTRHCEAA